MTLFLSKAFRFWCSKILCVCVRVCFKKQYCFITNRSGLGGGCARFRVSGGCEAQMLTERPQRTSVGLEARPEGSSKLRLPRDGFNKGFMASYRQATNKIKNFLEI